MPSECDNAEDLMLPNTFGSKRSRWYIMENFMVTAWIFKKFLLPSGKPKTLGIPHEIS